MKFMASWFLAGVLLCFSWPVYAQQSIPLAGKLNIMDQKFSVDLKGRQKEPVHLEVARSSEKSFYLELTVSHYRIDGLDISTILRGTFNIVFDQDAQPYVTGKLDSHYTLINNRPFYGPSVDFMIRNKEVVVRSLQLGPFSAFGKIYLTGKPDLDMTVRFAGVSLADVSALFQKGKAIEGEGLVDGMIDLNGTWDRLQIRGAVSSYNGFVGIHDYNTAQFNFEGIYPFLYINNSYIAQSDGLSFDVRGTLDLSDLEHFRNQMRGFVRSPLVSENGNNMEWTFKRLGSDQRSGTTELKYMIKGSRSGEDAGIFGVERRMEF